MSATYDVRLAILSVVIAIINSYISLDLAGRVTTAQGLARKLWLAGGAIAMGTGIWSMHLIAILAYNLPIPINYNNSIVFLSLLVVVFASGLALYIVSQEQVNKRHFLVGGSFIGLAIAAMYYIGIAATQVSARITYNLVLIALSVIVAIGASFCVLSLAFGLRSNTTSTCIKQQLGSLVLMGTAITEMHYTVIAAVFVHSTNQIVEEQLYSLEHSLLAIVIGITTLGILALALYTAFVDRRLRTEAALAESQRRLATLIDSLPGIVFSCANDPGWSMTYLSEGCLELTGYPSEELVGGAYNAITHPEDLPKVIQTINVAIALHQPYVVEYRIFTKSGQQKWLWEKGSGLFNSKGEVLGLEGFITDISELKRSDAALRQAEAKYRSIFENTVDGIFQTTPDGKYLSANPALARIYGYKSPESLIAEVCNIEQQIYVDSNRRAQFICLIEQHDAVSDFEAQIYRQDGSVIWISENARAVRDATGTLLYYEGTVEDITERKQTEQIQARFTAILEATTDCVGIANVQGNSLYLNQAGRKMLGIGSDEDISHRKTSENHPAWANEIILNEAIPAVLSGEVWTGETALKNRNGQEIPVSQVILAHKKPEGEVEFIATVMRDISDRKRMEAQLAYLANHDSLTGLFNRRHFSEQLEHHLALAQRYNHCGALLFIDLDEFKEINDTLGHQAGDELLQSLAKLLQEQLRETDVLARLGGDEFAILLPETLKSGVHLVTQRLMEALQHHVVVTNGQSVRISASIGVTLFPDHGMTADELLSRADLAMYKSKENGRNCLSVYTPDTDWRDQVESKNIWKNRICEALEQDLFVLYYQPISDLRSNQTSRYELLLRMVGKAGELIAPNTFLPIAETSGLICQIDRWVVRQAIHLIAASKEMGRDLELEVNLSGKSLADDELLAIIQREITLTGINPASLILEITETAAIADISRTQKFINALKQIGCKFALDDFGMGYSSFSQLKQLPVDYWKIDGSFIKNLSEDLADRHLVKAIVEFSHGLAKSTIAEFVGDEGTVQLLRHLGVDCAQGYYIGQPKPVTQLLVGDESISQVELSSLAVELLN